MNANGLRTDYMAPLRVYMLLFSFIVQLSVGCGGELKEHLIMLKKQYDSGEYAAAVEFWEARKAIEISPELSEKYPKDVLVDMLNRAADEGIPHALAHRFWHNVYDEESTAKLADLEEAFNGGVLDCGPELALILSIGFNEVDAGVEIADQYFGGNHLESAFAESIGEHERNVFLKIVKRVEKPKRSATGEELIQNGRLSSAWNAWNFLVREKLKSGKVIR